MISIHAAVALPFLAQLSFLIEDLGDLGGHFARARSINDSGAMRSGQSVFEEGDVPDGAYLVTSGRFEVFFQLKGGETVTLTHIGPKEFFGELALIDGEPRSATVKAVENSELVKIDSKEFDYLRRNFRPAAYKVVREISQLVCERLRRINSQILDVLNPEPALSD